MFPFHAQGKLIELYKAALIPKPACSQHQHTNVGPTLTQGRTDLKSTDSSRAKGGLGLAPAQHRSSLSETFFVAFQFVTASAPPWPPLLRTEERASERTNKRTRHEPPLIIFKRGEGGERGGGEGMERGGKGSKKYFRACVSRNRRPCSRSPLRSSGGCADSHCTCLPVTRVR